MSIRIRTNVASLTAQRHLAASTRSLSNTSEKLASGRRINKSADDAAGLAIAENIRSDVRSLHQARRNANDGVSLLQIAEGGLTEIGNITQRLKELAIQGASDTIGKKERKYLDIEFQQMKAEIDRIANSTEYNGLRMLQAPTEEEEELAQRLEVQVDVRYDPKLDGLDKDQAVNVIRLDFSKINAMTGGENSLGLGASDSEDGTRVFDKPEAQRSIEVIDEAIERVAGFRAQIGALQNRLTSTDRNIAVRIENLSAAKSRILDADFARETAALAESSILQQAGASVLTQANQLPQIALKLLQ